MLATFTDGNPLAAATDFAVSVDWDGAVPGSTSDTVQLVSASARSSAWEVVGDAAYPGPGSYPLHITVTDVDSSTNTFTDANTTIVINFPVPRLASISPGHIGVGYPSPLALTLVGANFFTQSVVLWNGAALPTTYVSPTMLTASVPSSDFKVIGEALVMVANPQPGGGPSHIVRFRVLPSAPTSSVSPLPRVGTSLSFPVTVTGTDPDDAGASSPSGIASFTIYEAISVVDHAIEIDFGRGGLGDSPNTSAADGYYALSFAPGAAAGQPGIGSTHHFDRLLGDVTGDGVVDNNDLDAIAAEISQSSPSGFAPLNVNVNGDGSMTASDAAFATRSKGHKLAPGLLLG